MPWRLLLQRPRSILTNVLMTNHHRHLYSVALPTLPKQRQRYSTLTCGSSPYFSRSSQPTRWFGFTHQLGCQFMEKIFSAICDLAVCTGYCIRALWRFRDPFFLRKRFWTRLSFWRCRLKCLGLLTLSPSLVVQQTTDTTSNPFYWFWEMLNIGIVY